ncbi:LADA_0B06964g1_1 [Lachancea dasiensis]|uniref:LADA_0B06964g1_1 n=1 Tax=Lachancea dasiensis TaxID=1072105 RepID=A0A1G4IUE9_9SACH|nr:LADA_0B06964g1_1 [Lachancea dasiensis]
MTIGFRCNSREMSSSDAGGTYLAAFVKNMVLFDDDKSLNQALAGTTASLYSSGTPIESEGSQADRDRLFGQHMTQEQFGGGLQSPMPELHAMARSTGPPSLQSAKNPVTPDSVITNSEKVTSSSPGVAIASQFEGLNQINPRTLPTPGGSFDVPAPIPPDQVISRPSSANSKPVKRKYSRNGCTECKRRRMKCDEGKPTCWQCARLNRECVYVIRTKNRKRKSKKNDAPTASDSANASYVQKPDPILSNSAGSFVPPATAIPAGNISNSINIASVPDVTDSPALGELPNLIPTKNINSFDANLLIRNLNDIVNMKLNDSIIYEDLKTMDFSDLDIPELNLIPPERPCPAVPISFLVDSIMTFNMTLESFKLGGSNDKYLEVFYYDCLDSIAPFFQNQGNPLRDILLSFAKGEPYLLSSILAVGASISHRKTRNVEDEKSYCAYLSHCLSLLTEQFKDENNVYNKIEPIILTVLMLTWDCIYTMNSQWRSHLKGVTELFKKINSGNSSKVLNVAKCWFKVIETFASISTVLGGALVDENDLDLIFAPYDHQYIDSLKFLNIMTPLNEFNLLRGHKEDFDLVIKEVFKALNVIRHSEQKYFSEQDGILDKNLDYLLWSNPNTETFKQQLSYFKIQKILVEIDRQSDYVFIDKTGVIPITNQSHPKNSQIVDNAIDLVKLRSGEEIAISWYDISHQTQVLSFLLIVLLKLLGIPKQSIAIQQVVQKITSFFGFLDTDDPPHNLRTCYCNFAILIAGLNAIDEGTRSVIKKYYKVNGGRFQRLTEHNLNRLEKVWYGNEKAYKLEDQDVLTW